LGDLLFSLVGVKEVIDFAGGEEGVELGGLLEGGEVGEVS